MAKEKKQLPDGVVATAREVAAAFGVAVRTVKTWRADGMPRQDDENYNLIEIATWKQIRDARLDRGKKGKDGKVSDEEARRVEKEFNKWNMRWKQAQARVVELKLKKERGELLPRDEVEAGRVRRIAVVKQNFLRLPQHVAATLAAINDPVEVRKVLERQIRGIIGQFEEGGDNETSH